MNKIDRKASGNSAWALESRWEVSREQRFLLLGKCSCWLCVMKNLENEANSIGEKAELPSGCQKKRDTFQFFSLKRRVAVYICQKLKEP
jgi:hypothetical protein